MDSVEKSLRQAVRTRVRSRLPLFEMCMVLLVAVVGWAAFQAWQVVREAEDTKRSERRSRREEFLTHQRTELSRLLELHAVRDDYFGFERHAQPSVQEMREALRRFTVSTEEKDWNS